MQSCQLPRHGTCLVDNAVAMFLTSADPFWYSTLQWAVPFNTPVDTSVYTAYLDYIETPMDFSTVRRKCESGAYANPDEVAADMRLVFTNAQSYNKNGTDVFVMSVTLQVSHPAPGNHDWPHYTHVTTVSLLDLCQESHGAVVGTLGLGISPVVLFQRLHAVECQNTRAAEQSHH